ncbi:MAG: hypothetical protein AAF610_05495, partial [Pseudomonadota bacterium]
SRITTDRNTAAHFERTSDLAATIRGLAPTVDPDEARQVAEATMVLALDLANEYQLTKPPIAHNVLVNMGMRPRGLCTHWAEDVLRHLDGLDLATLDLYWAVAYPTRPFRLEHSGALVTARGQPFETGIVLDAWRDSGIVYFGPVTDDTRYAWQRLHNTITDPPPDGAVVPPESLYD